MPNKKILSIFVAWLVIINLFALFALNRFNLNPDTAYTWIDPGKAFQSQSFDIAKLHAGWDSFWYLDIVQNGYNYTSGQLSNVVFFPLYPYLIKVFAFIFGGTVLTGWILSSVFLFLALFYLHKLVREFHKEVNPDHALYFLLIFPTAFFLNTVYTESLFLFLSVACFYYVLRKNFVLAAIVGMLAALTRVTGVLLLIPLAIEYYRFYGARIKPELFSLLLIPASLFSFFTYHFARFGDFLLFFKVESTWGRNFHLNTSHFGSPTNPAIVNFLIDAGFVIFALAMIYLVYRRFRLSYAAYMLATVLVALSTGTMMSIGRYILVLFPMYLVLAALKNRILQHSWVLVSILLLAMNVIQFVNYYWAG